MAKLLAIPGVAAGRRESWQVLEGDQPTTVPWRRLMTVPDGDDAVARTARLHELLHSKITRGHYLRGLVRALHSRDDVGRQAVQAAEDIRLLYRFRSSPVRDEYEAGLAAVRRELVASIGALAGVPEAAPLLVQTLLGWASTDPDRTPSSWKRKNPRVFRAARELRQALARHSPHLFWLRPSDFGTGPALAYTLELADDLERIVRPLLSRPSAAAKGTDKKEEERAAAPWGRLTVEDHAREDAVPVARLDTRWQRADYGTRLTPDAAARLARGEYRRLCRRRMRRLAPAAVLIDGSGSMNWDPERLIELIERAPATWLGIYAGSSEEGTLHVVARDGRRMRTAALADILDNLPPGNIVDGPALEVLGRVPARRRLWVSDGHVTGIGDFLDEACTREAEALRRRYRIERRRDLPRRL